MRDETRCEECQYCWPEEWPDGVWSKHCNLALPGGRLIDKEYWADRPAWCPLRQLRGNDGPEA